MACDQGHPGGGSHWQSPRNHAQLRRMFRWQAADASPDAVLLTLAQLFCNQCAAHPAAVIVLFAFFNPSVHTAAPSGNPNATPTESSRGHLLAHQRFL